MPSVCHGLAYRERPSSPLHSQNALEERVLGWYLAGLCLVTEPLRHLMQAVSSLPVPLLGLFGPDALFCTSQGRGLSETGALTGSLTYVGAFLTHVPLFGDCAGWKSRFFNLTGSDLLSLNM